MAPAAQLVCSLAAICGIFTSFTAFKLFYKYGYPLQKLT